MNRATGCGSATCRCTGAAHEGAAPACVNGIALHAPGQRPGEDELRERAWAELLRQEAVRHGLLPRHLELEAPVLSAGARRIVQDMLESALTVRTPTQAECRFHYDTNPEQFWRGRLVHARHILFGAAPGADMHALSIRAEHALVELSGGKAPPGHFAQLARELSNCPSGARGGDLGWFGPDECAPELANELFHQKNPMHGMGLHPRLVHSRDGFHIVEVLGRKQGRRIPFDEVCIGIGQQLAQHSRERTRRQYLRLLAGRALIEGVRLDEAAPPLFQ